MKDHKDQLNQRAKELYHSIHAPEELREKTLAALNESENRDTKAKILHVNFKVIGTVAACFVLCLGLMLSGILHRGIGISIDGNEISNDIAVCHTEHIDFVPEVMSASVKNAECVLPGTALKLDIDFNGKFTVQSNRGTLAGVDSNGTIREIPQNSELDGESEIYVITDGDSEITVTFTADEEVKALLIRKNSDGTFAVRVK